MGRIHRPQTGMGGTHHARSPDRRSYILSRNLWFLRCYRYMSDDDDLRVDMRKLAPAQQEALRMRVMAAINDGMPSTEAVRVFGVNLGSIRNERRRQGAVSVCGCREFAGENHAEGELEEALVHVITGFPTHPKPTETVQPRHRRLDHPPHRAQPGAMLLTTARDTPGDAPFTKPTTVEIMVMAPIRVQRARLAPRSATLTTHRPDPVHQRQQLGDIVAVGTGEPDP